jgi:hypothetical protein
VINIKVDWRRSRRQPSPMGSRRIRVNVFLELLFNLHKDLRAIDASANQTTATARHRQLCNRP